ncbi:MAG TPA: RNA polymerase sigma-70 factor [Puia sp.]|jgi:RNA polymerase sigma-70 factor (ECF subfamily)
MPACAEGNKSAPDFKCLFDIYKNRVFRYAQAISHSPFIAEEITQEIFIKLWLYRDTLSRVDNLDAYIFRMARNKTLNYLRRAAHETKILKELQSRMIPENNNAAEHLLAADQHKMLQEAITRLSPQRRLVYQLSRNQGLNHKEIASQLRLSPNTVKNHLVNALKFIREYLNVLNSVIVFLLLFAGL